MDLILPIAFALLAAALWGLSNHVQRLGLDDTDPLTGAFISVGLGALLMWLAAPFFVQTAWLSQPGTLIFALMGVFFPALGQRFQIAGVGLVGPSLTASLSAFTPVIAVAIGVAVLGEHLNMQGFLGIALMVIGFVLATYSPKGIKRGFPLWALLVPLGAALVRGISQPGLKLGLGTVPNPAFALLVMTTVSTVTLGLMLLNHRAKGRVRIGPTGRNWFALNSLLVCGGILCLNMALARGGVTLVSPLAATTPLWALAFGAFVFRRERIGATHVAIAVMVVVGSVLIVTR